MGKSELSYVIPHPPSTPHLQRDQGPSTQPANQGPYQRYLTNGARVGRISPSSCIILLLACRSIARKQTSSSTLFSDRIWPFTIQLTDWANRPLARSLDRRPNSQQGEKNILTPCRAIVKGKRVKLRHRKKKKEAHERCVGRNPLRHPRQRPSPITHQNSHRNARTADQHQQARRVCLYQIFGYSFS